MKLHHEHIQVLRQVLRLAVMQVRWVVLVQRAGDIQRNLASQAALETEQATKHEPVRQVLLKITTLPTIKTMMTGAPKSHVQGSPR